MKFNYKLTDNTISVYNENGVKLKQLKSKNTIM